MGCWYNFLWVVNGFLRVRLKIVSFRFRTIDDFTSLRFTSHFYNGGWLFQWYFKIVSSRFSIINISLQILNAFGQGLQAHLDSVMNFRNFCRMGMSSDDSTRSYFIQKIFWIFDTEISWCPID
jgi:hypothetical protein